ncbi:hypothetical protein IWZ03DRAFT_244369 [Phyllosticta citriasiana]|uniref:Secreted protein n=1 Tax=Phyllosticta citriasiana TaxID=595635 RepID=A0ABR1KFU2_9PEZI
MIFSLSVPVCLSVCLRLFLLLSISPLLLSFCLFLLIHFPSRFHLTPPQRRVRARVGSRATAQAGPSSTTQKQRDYSRHPIIYTERGVRQTIYTYATDGQTARISSAEPAPTSQPASCASTCVYLLSTRLSSVGSE